MYAIIKSGLESCYELIEPVGDCNKHLLVGRTLVKTSKAVPVSREYCSCTDNGKEGRSIGAVLSYYEDKQIEAWKESTKSSVTSVL